MELLGEEEINTACCMHSKYSMTDTFCVSQLQETKAAATKEINFTNFKNTRCSVLI